MAKPPRNLQEARLQSVQLVKETALKTARKMIAELDAPASWFVEGWLLAAAILMAEQNDELLRNWHEANK